MSEAGISVADELHKLYTKAGELTPEAVEAKARNPRSPLHGYFEWDDTRAAHLYRLEQARQLIRTVRITTDNGDVRAFHPVCVNEGGKATHYVAASEVGEKTDLRDQFRARLSSEIRGMVRRWKQHAIYYDLDDVLTEIETTWNG